MDSHLWNSGGSGGEQHPLGDMRCNSVRLCFLNVPAHLNHGQAEILEKAWLPVTDDDIDLSAAGDGRKVLFRHVRGAKNESPSDTIKFQQS